MPRTDLPLSRLITVRARELRLSRSELVSRSGYKNISKGVRRLDQVLAGKLEGTATLLRGLPNALDLAPELIQQAIDDTVRQLAEEQDARWRASFQPAAYLLGTTKRPSQIWAYGLTGGADTHLKIPLDLTQAPQTFVAQALAVVRRTPVVEFFGATTGFVVNYSPDHAVRFDCQGRPVETIEQAYRPGEVALYLSGCRLSPQVFGNVRFRMVKLEVGLKASWAPASKSMRTSQLRSTGDTRHQNVSADHASNSKTSIIRADEINS